MKYVKVVPKKGTHTRIPEIKVHIQPMHTGRTLCGYSVVEMKMIEDSTSVEPTCEWCIESLNDLMDKIKQMPTTGQGLWFDDGNEKVVIVDCTSSSERG